MGEFRLSWARDLDLDLGSGHTVYLYCITRRPLPMYQISLKSKKLFVDSYLLPTSKSRDTKTRTKIKIPTGYFLGIAP